MRNELHFRIGSDEYLLVTRSTLSMRRGEYETLQRMDPFAAKTVVRRWVARGIGGERHLQRFYAQISPAGVSHRDMGDSVVDLIVERLGRRGPVEFVLLKKERREVTPPIAKVPEIMDLAPVDLPWSRKKRGLIRRARSVACLAHSI